MLKKLKIFSSFFKINHFITTRKGGTSVGNYEGLNLALNTGDDNKTVLENRKILSEKIGKKENDFIYLDQIHGNKVFVAEKKDKGRGTLKIDKKLNYDSVITNEKGIVLMVLVADCIPIIIYDKIKGVIGVIHSGWKGTKENILGKAVEKCIEIYGSRKKDIVISIGPGISQKNYEVGKDISSNFGDEFYIKKENGKYNLDLRAIIRSQALELGLLKENIEICDECSFDNKDIFFSARRDGLETGRFGCGIYLT